MDPSPTLKMQRYAFHASWVPGKANAIADALSRAPIDSAFPADEFGEGPTSFATRVRINLISAVTGSDANTTDPLLAKVAATVTIDPVMIALRAIMIQTGFPNEKCNLPLPLRPFWCVRSELAIDKDDRLIAVGARVFVSETIRHNVLQKLLIHQGTTKLRQRARQKMYWPSMDNHIVTVARTCPPCAEYLPSHPPEPLLPHQKASRIFEFIHADFDSHNGRDFLILAYQFSGWPQVFPFSDKNTSARKAVDAVRSFFLSAREPPLNFGQTVEPSLHPMRLLHSCVTGK